MRKKTILLCIAVVFLVVLSTVFISHHKKDAPDGCKTPFTTYAQANIASSGDFLYYCDVQKDHALCSYNLKTNETQLLLEKMNELRQTGSGVYCIVNRELYQITDTSVQKLSDISDSSFDFIDVAYYKERIYTLTDHGIYCTHPDSKEEVKISDLIAERFICSDDFLLFEYDSGDSMHGYYEITEDLQILQKSAVVGSAASIYDGTLYYPFSETLWSVDLSSDKRNRTNEGHLPGYPWSSIQATSFGVFLRCYQTGDIWFYDFETKESRCIISQQQKE